MATYSIYMLVENDKPYYVGCTFQGDKRYPISKRHQFEVLETTDSNKNAAFLEMYWIDTLRSWGFKLKNNIKCQRPYPISLQWRYNPLLNNSPFASCNYQLKKAS